MEINAEKLQRKNLICRIVIAALLGIFLTFFATVKFFQTKKVTFEMTVTQHFNGIVQVFYLGKDKKSAAGYTEKNSCIFQGIRTDIPCKVKLDIPFYHPQLLRVDFNHGAPGKVKITDLKITGRKSWYQPEIRIQYLNDCALLEKNADSWELKNGSRDPYILLDCRKVRPEMQADLYAAGAVFCLTFLLILLVLQKITFFQDKEKSVKADLLLAAAFLLLLILPASKINREKISVKENRVLSQFPEFFDNSLGQINSRFGSEFEKYFNDRFFGRDQVIFPYRRFLSFCNSINRKYIGQQVLEGKDDWYFYRIENSVENFQNINALPEKTMKIWLDKLIAFNAECEKRNIKFYYYIAPDKNRVYGEYFTYACKIKPDSEGRIARWVEYIRKNSSIKVIYPLEEMMKKKKDGLLFYKNNTHWNHLGSYYGYLALMEVIRKDFPTIPVFKPATPWALESHHYGDLYLLAPEAVRKDMTKYKVPRELEKKHYCYGGDIDEEFHNRSCRHTVLFLKDSFGAYLLDYMFRSFKHIRSLHKFYFSEAEIPLFLDKKQKPDMIIFEHVGRNLPRMEKFLQSTDLLLKNKR